MINLPLAILGLVVFFLSQGAGAEPSSIDSALNHGKLVIASSSTPVSGGGKATLMIGALTLESGSYLGEFQMKVSPYFFKSEKGKLTIAAPDESLHKLTNGIAFDFIGKATSTGSGKIRPVNGKVTPSGADRGIVTLWFMASGRKMTFNTSYHFGEKSAANR